VKHASGPSLDQIEPLLASIRGIPGLVEKSRGVFYRHSKAFLHFHEDPSGMHADVRLDGDEFVRFRVETPDEQEALVETVRAAVT
jgi:hypothetical protein